MFRAATLILAVTAGALLISTARGDGLTPGKPYTGELGANDKEDVAIIDPPVRVRGYGTRIDIDLKSGQSITVSAAVTGKDRQVALALVDPTGKVLKIEKFTTRGVKLNWPEAGTSATYKIVIVSDQIGPFTLEAAGPPNAQLEQKKLEDKIEQLKAELADTEAKLKALKEKGLRTGDKSN